MADQQQRHSETCSGVASGSACLDVAVTPALATVHLPPDRAVITTPALVGLMEQCIALAEAERDPHEGAGPWNTASAEIRHRAGLRTGETVRIRVSSHDATREGTRWAATAHAAVGGQLIGEGTLVRVRVRPCRS